MQIASRQPLWDEGMPKGTVLVLRASAASMTARIAGGNVAAGSGGVTVDWGDGTKNVYSSFRNVSHTYSRAKDYTVKISDDLTSFGYTSTTIGSEPHNDMIVELKSVGSRVVTIEGYAFNNCHKMRGVINLPSVTSINGYAFGTTQGITDFILPSMTHLVQTSFYWGPTASAMYCDNVIQIDSSFWEYYGGRLVDVYIRKKTCQQIKAMSGFPFKAGAAVRFHGSDGIVTGDGRITLG